MAWRYKIRQGELWHLGTLVARGYSGLDDGDGVKEPGEGKNDPSMIRVRNVGPLPPGSYQIHGPPFDGGHLGPDVLRLDPAPDNVMFGRSGFYIHADAVRLPGAASQGCVILDHATRHKIWDSGDHYLTVVTGDDENE